jgi:hypothetical protein
MEHPIVTRRMGTERETNEKNRAVGYKPSERNEWITQWA